MPRKPRVPSYRLHKATGQAVVTLSGVDHYLGLHDTPESRAAYERLLAEWLAGGRAPVVDRAPDLTLAEVLDAYWAHAEKYYAAPDGSPTSQVDRVRRALGTARDLYGPGPARKFGPVALRACRAKIVATGVCRRVANQRVDCLKRAFKWAVSEELVPADAYQALRTVEGLRRGRTEAPDHDPVAPVPQAHLDAVLPLLPGFLGDAARLQLLTAARPGEVLGLEPARIDRSGPVWVYEPPAHKTAWRNHRRRIFLGPRAQELVLRFLPARCKDCGKEGRAGRAAFWDPGACPGCGGPAEAVRPGQYLFSPAVSEEERSAARRAARKTPVQPSQRDRAVKERKRPPGNRYRVTTYSRAARDACLKAGVPEWHPHQLRHNAATLLVEQFGWDVARIVLGHRTLDTTRIYGEDDVRKAMGVIARVG